MNHTTINIIGDDKSFKYIIEYSPTQKYWEKIPKNSENSINNKYIKQDDRIDIINDSYQYLKFSTNWVDKNSYINQIQDIYNEVISQDGDSHNIIPLTDELIPNRIKISNINIYFPVYSVDTYTNTKYILTINTWVNGKYIYLGSYVLNRINSLATNGIKIFNNERYYEYHQIEIIDPYEITYNDDWKQFRNKVCNEPLIDNEYNFNNTGSILNFTLYPVDLLNDIYIVKDYYTGGQNSINFGLKKSDYFGVNINPIFNDNGFSIEYKININEYYKNELDTYLKETYNIELPIYKCRILILDKNDPEYHYFETKSKEPNDKNLLVFSKKELTDYENWIDPINPTYQNNSIHFTLFDSWDKWKPGLVFIGAMTIYNNIEDIHDNIDDNNLLYLLSNEIPITKEIFKYLIIDQKQNINYINLDLIQDMKYYNINAVNKIVNNVIQIDKHEDSKSNIIQPIFFRARESDNLIIHPEVTENICINLDAYKSKVEYFILRIEGITFKQISSTSQGIIFKISGNLLPNKKTDGIYYILDHNQELITTGKYTYEQ